MDNPNFNPDSVRQTLSIFMRPGNVYEIRALQATLKDNWSKKTGIVSGYFNDPLKALSELSRIERAEGIYFTMNCCDPNLLARVYNRLDTVTSKTSTTSDINIIERHWLLIDLDHDRLSKTSATDLEKQATWNVAHKTGTTLHQMGWPSPVVADSGNGYHLLYPISLPNTELSKEIVSGCLKGLALKFNEAKVKVDVTVSNSSRIVKLYGTVAAKGENVPEIGRVHRISGITNHPERLIAVPTEKIQEIASWVPKEVKKEVSAHGTNGVSPKDLDKWIGDNNLNVVGPFPWSGDGRLWRFNDCPFSDAHVDGAYLIQFNNGAIYSGCHHNSCKSLGDNLWSTLRKQIDPNWKPASVPMVDFNPDYHDWPTPLPIQMGIPPVLPFKEEYFPESLYDWIEDISVAANVPLDFAAATVLVMLGALIGIKFKIQPYSKGNWQVTPNLWGICISPPGSRKSPVVNEVFKILKTFEKEARNKFKTDEQKHKQAQDQYDVQKKQLTQQRNTLQKTMQKKSGSGAQNAAATPVQSNPQLVTTNAKLHSLQPPDKPKRKRFLVNDATPAVLAEIVADNPNGVLNFRDEISGFFQQMNSPHFENSRTFFLEGWNGDSEYTVDRKSYDTVDIENNCLSLFGTTQPDVFAKQVRAAISGDQADGFLQRIQVMVFPDQAKKVKIVNQDPKLAAQERVERICRAIVDFKGLNIINIPNTQDTSVRKPKTQVVKYADDAQDLFFDWLYQSDNEVRDDQELFPAFAAAKSKYPSLMASLSVIFFVVDMMNGQPYESVQLIHTARAAAIVEYLESHARRVYDSFSGSDRKEAVALLKKIKQGRLGKQFTVAEVYNRRWSLLQDKEKALKAVNDLEELGWLVRENRQAKGDKGGRPSLLVHVNPKIDEIQQIISNDPREGDLQSDRKYYIDPDRPESSSYERKMTWLETLQTILDRTEPVPQFQNPLDFATGANQ